MIPAQRDRRRKNFAFTVVLDPTSMTRTSGDATGTITPTWTDGLGNEITPMDTPTWTSADESVATVDEDGVVTFAGVGGPINVSAHAGRAMAACAVTGST